MTSTNLPPIYNIKTQKEKKPSIQYKYTPFLCKPLPPLPPQFRTQLISFALYSDFRRTQQGLPLLRSFFALSHRNNGFRTRCRHREAIEPRHRRFPSESSEESPPSDRRTGTYGIIVFVNNFDCVFFLEWFWVGLLVSCRLSWRRSCWKRDRVICLSIGRSLVMMMRKRKLFWIRFGVFFLSLFA